MPDDLEARYEDIVRELQTIVASLDDRLAQAYITKACIQATLEYINSHDELADRMSEEWDDNPVDVRVEIMGRGLEIVREEFERARKEGLVYSLN